MVSIGIRKRAANVVDSDMARISAGSLVVAMEARKAIGRSIRRHRRGWQLKTTRRETSTGCRWRSRQLGTSRSEEVAEGSGDTDDNGERTTVQRIDRHRLLKNRSVTKNHDRTRDNCCAFERCNFKF